MTQNAWKSFAVKERKFEGNTNSAISGGRFVGVGTHKLTIDSVEQRESRNGSPYLRLGLSNEDGQTINATVFLHYVYNDEPMLSKKYKELGSAICPAKDKKYEFFHIFLPNNPHFLPSLVGMTINADVAKGKTGFSIEKDGDSYKLCDVASGEALELDDNIPNSFEGYKDAAEAGRHATVNGEKLRRAFNEIEQFSAADDADKNVEAISAILSDAAKEGSL